MPTEEAALYIEAALQVEVEKRGRTFGDSDELQGHIVQIARMFTEPTTKFGILLCGGVGNGKSSMMYALQNLIKSLKIPLNGNTTFDTWGMRVESAKFIYNQVKVDSQEYRQIRIANMLGIDDLGEEEPTLMNYGNRVTPVIDLISYRYCRMLFTMVTTNLTPAQIRSTYGDRIADRFNEMMLILPYPMQANINKVLVVMGAMLPPIPPSDATELRLSIALRGFYLHPVITAVLRFTVRSPTVSNGNQVAH